MFHPGPLQATEDGEVLTVDGRIVAECSSRANAELFAIAPEMHAVLSRFARRVASWQDYETAERLLARLPGGAARW